MFTPEEKEYKDERLNSILQPDERYLASTFGVFTKPHYGLIVTVAVILASIVSFMIAVIISIALNWGGAEILIIFSLLWMPAVLPTLINISKKMQKGAFIGITQKHLYAAYVERSSYKKANGHYLYKLYLIENLSVGYIIQGTGRYGISVNAHNDTIINFTYQGEKIKLKIPGLLRSNPLALEAVKESETIVEVLKTQTNIK